MANNEYTTNNVSTALKYLKRALPNYVINKKTIKPIITLLLTDKIKIGNPEVYCNNSPIIRSIKLTDSDKQLLDNWIISLIKK